MSRYAVSAANAERLDFRLVVRLKFIWGLTATADVAGVYFAGLACLAVYYLEHCVIKGIRVGTVFFFFCKWG